MFQEAKNAILFFSGQVRKWDIDLVDFSSNSSEA